MRRSFVPREENHQNSGNNYFIIKILIIIVLSGLIYLFGYHIVSILFLSTGLVLVFATVKKVDNSFDESDLEQDRESIIFWNQKNKK